MAKTVLVVDDEPFILRSLSFVLERAGYTVLQSRDGEDALEKLRDHRPAVCILDVMMPKRNGYEVCQIVKGDPELSGTHVILLTAKGQESARGRGLSAGADDFMTKPFSPSLIVEKVTSVFAAPTSGPVSGGPGAPAHGAAGNSGTDEEPIQRG